MDLFEWIIKNQGYEYYVNDFTRLCYGLDGAVSGSNYVATFNGYMVFNAVIRDRQIYLTEIPSEYKFDSISSEHTNQLVQSKLIGEYNKFFSIKTHDKTGKILTHDYKLTRANIIELEKYLKIATDKITSGFELFEQLLDEQNITYENKAILEFRINSSFTITSLIQLLDSYNRIYSYLMCVAEKGPEGILKLSEEELYYSHTMVIESIHIASDGGVGGIFEKIALLIPKIFEVVQATHLAELDIKKRELECELVSLQLDAAQTSNLRLHFDTLCHYREQLLNNPNDPIAKNLMEYEIMKIQQLGTYRIDVRV